MISEVKRDKSAKLKENDLSPLPYFDWDKAKYFYYVTRLKSFNQAGQFLKISQSGLSRKVQTLESHLGFRVFNRNQKGVELTRKGEQLFKIIETTFLSLKGLSFDPIFTNDEKQRRHIRILATHPFASYILHRPLMKFSKLHPEIFFEIITDDHSIDLLMNDIDMAIRPYDETVKGVIQEHLSTLEKKLFASQEYLKEFGEPKNIEELKDHHIISHSQPENHPYSDVNWILRLGKSQGETHIPIFSSNSIELLIDAAQEGLGIIGSFEEMTIIQKSKLVRILSNIEGSINRDFIIYPEFLQKDQQFMLFKNYLLQDFAKFRS